MCTIAVIDDELYMRKAIITHMNTCGIDYDLVGEASNGEEGLILLEEKSPQIAIVDISMPRMDGLTMIQKAVERGYKTRFVLLTSYSEFDYAKKAITLSVKDYLLKPVNTRELCEVLHRIQEAIEKDYIEEERINILEKKNLELMKSDFFSSIITTGSIADMSSALEMLSELGIDERVFEKYFLCCLDCTMQDMEEILVKIEGVCNQNGGTCFKTVMGFLYVICPSEAWNEYEGLFSRLDIPFGVSKENVGLENVAKAYVQSYANMKSAQSMVNNQISETVKKYIDENVGDCELNINAIAKAIYINYSYLCYCFKRDFKMTVNEYITQRRMECAKSLFIEGAQNISQVAIQVGYNSNSYFSKAFKKYYGVSPSEYIQKG